MRTNIQNRDQVRPGDKKIKETVVLRLPDLLTLSRLALVPVLLILLSVSFPLTKSLALLIFLIAGITDYLDGFLARKVYGTSSFGRLMDPLTDKVMVCAVFVSFVELQLVPAWMVVIIISREFLVTGLRLLAVSQGQLISAGKWGKHKTVWQILAIMALLSGLAMRHDVFRHANPHFLADYDETFGFIAYGISGAVVMITVISGTLYFWEHKALLGKQI